MSWDGKIVEQKIVVIKHHDMHLLFSRIGRLTIIEYPHKGGVQPKNLSKCCYRITILFKTLILKGLFRMIVLD